MVKYALIIMVIANSGEVSAVKVDDNYTKDQCNIAGLVYLEKENAGKILRKEFDCLPVFKED